MTSLVSVAKCKKRLSLLWFSGAGLIFLLVFFQSIFGHYSGRTAAAWSWFLPTVMPTLSLMIGILVADTFGPAKPDKNIDPFIYKLAQSLSAAYFMVVLATITLQPFSAVPPLELLAMSNLWLGPLQGLVTGSIGAFFVKVERAG